MSDFEIVNGDSLDVLRQLPDECVDALVTDPPAGIGFMGKDWDADKGGREKWIAWLAAIMGEARRALKPGAHGLVWALPRTSHWTAMALEDSGFEVRDVITHHFGTGFPKGIDVAKAIDKRRDDREQILGVTRFLADARNAAGTTNAEIDLAFGTRGMAGHWTSSKEQPHVPTPEQWERLRALLSLDARPGFAEVDAEVRRLNERKGQHGDTWKAAEVIGEVEPNKGPGFSVSRFTGDNTIRRASETAAEWQGWNTTLKPASENWILVRKPLIGTVAENVLAHGTGAINVDACRIGTTTSLCRATGEESGFDPNVGRWPANVVLSHTEWCDPGEAASSAGGCPPGCPVRALDDQSGTIGASRFFYCAKPGTAEKNAGTVAAEGAARGNTHPTVKSIALMDWLIRLVTPPGGLILDAFAGSGTTGCAAVKGGWSFLGIEKDPEFARIATDRIAHWAAKKEAA